MAHQVYENVVLSNKINDILATSINLNDYMTIDTNNKGYMGLLNGRFQTKNYAEIGSKQERRFNPQCSQCLVRKRTHPAAYTM